ncbi:hypothetical protein FGO68_gene3828 [Halteria grandinella]|uniref:Uncharacterized protein n=1 Tax=Halteria grandinella TaxID=5974 RepID=A0A8J8P7N3_HALGN|nr:hypothetical protein FGO68_gene3828 [Halteria grandinella]
MNFKVLNCIPSHWRQQYHPMFEAAIMAIQLSLLILAKRQIYFKLNIISQSDILFPIAIIMTTSIICLNRRHHTMVQDYRLSIYSLNFLIYILISFSNQHLYIASLWVRQPVIYCEQKEQMHH